MGRWLLNVLIAIDQLMNTVAGPVLNLIPGVEHPFGAPDETLSSVLGKNRRRCRACYWVCRALHLLDPNHCEWAIEHDEGKQ